MNRAPSDASALLETASQLASYPQQNTKKKSIDRVAFDGQFNFQLFFAACDVDLLLMQLHPRCFVVRKTRRAMILLAKMRLGD
jgi:hypothetical protein